MSYTLPTLVPFASASHWNTEKPRSIRGFKYSSEALLLDFILPK